MPGIGNGVGLAVGVGVIVGSGVGVAAGVGTGVGSTVGSGVTDTVADGEAVWPSSTLPFNAKAPIRIIIRATTNAPPIISFLSIYIPPKIRVN
ncbi:hypothetical protein CUJ83_01310 [Methanocella sp. CWC-04]|uniref:Uncharacterized protein n=1 Tax=Methanooceanicella nereidis TaxID=2052831 RepID=A0AAP2RAA4_9EURY|nr:hypothetical protein [Methanocella sp. CWC-04]